MLMRENKGFFAFAFDSAHVKYSTASELDLNLTNAEQDCGGRRHQALPEDIKPGKKYFYLESFGNIKTSRAPQGAALVC